MLKDLIPLTTGGDEEDLVRHLNIISEAEVVQVKRTLVFHQRVVEHKRFLQRLLTAC